jgi:hypothetical protein
MTVTATPNLGWSGHAALPSLIVGGDSMNVDKAASVETTRPRAAQLGR